VDANTTKQIIIPTQRKNCFMQSYKAIFSQFMQFL